MDFASLLDIVGDEPLFESGLLLAGAVDPADVRRQLSRWGAAGRIVRLRRGLYALAPPFQKTRPHPFVVANRLAPGSYVSLQSALAHRGLIPEHVPVTTSVTGGRPARRDTRLGTFQFHHLRRELLAGYRREEVQPGQYAYVATPVKALLDLVCLVPGADSREYLEQLRLSHLDRLAADAAPDAIVASRPKLQRALRILDELAQAERQA